MKEILLFLKSVFYLNIKNTKYLDISLLSNVFVVTEVFLMLKVLHCVHRLQIKTYLCLLHLHVLEHFRFFSVFCPTFQFRDQFLWRLRCKRKKEKRKKRNVVVRRQSTAKRLMLKSGRVQGALFSCNFSLQVLQPQSGGEQNASAYSPYKC